MIDYDSFSRCHLTDIFFAIFAGAKELSLGSSFNGSVIFCYKFFRKVFVNMV